MAYQIQYDTGVEKAISRLPKQMQARIVRRIGLLSEDPRPEGPSSCQARSRTEFEREIIESFKPFTTKSL